MASYTSAILGLLKNIVRSTFQGGLLSLDEGRAAVLSRVMENQSRAKLQDDANRPRQHTITGTE